MHQISKTIAILFILMSAENLLSMQHSIVRHKKLRHSTASIKKPIPNHIRADIEAISDRTNTNCKHIILADAYATDGIHMSIDQSDWHKSRFLHILPPIAHEFGHISLNHNRFATYDHENVDFYIPPYEREFDADERFAIKTGIANHAALNHNLYSHTNGKTHPSSHDRAKKLYQIHKNNRLNESYLDGRFWKLGFVLDSYNRQFREYENRTKDFISPDRQLVITFFKKFLDLDSHLKKYISLHESDIDRTLSHMPADDFKLFAQELCSCAHVAKEVTKSDNKAIADLISNFNKNRPS